MRIYLIESLLLTNSSLCELRLCEVIETEEASFLRELPNDLKHSICLDQWKITNVLIMCNNFGCNLKYKRYLYNKS